jgi:hypothetical protein
MLFLTAFIYYYIFHLPLFDTPVFVYMLYILLVLQGHLNIFVESLRCAIAILLNSHVSAMVSRPDFSTYFIVLRWGNYLDFSTRGVCFSVITHAASASRCASVPGYRISAMHAPPARPEPPSICAATGRGHAFARHRQPPNSSSQPSGMSLAFSVAMHVASIVLYRTYRFSWRRYQNTFAEFLIFLIWPVSSPTSPMIALIIFSY